MRKPNTWFSCLAVLAAVVSAALLRPSAGQDKGQPSATGSGPRNPQAEPAEVVAVREANRAFVAAFAKADAKAIAALWTENAEYDGLDAEPMRGRAAIEAAYARFFKENPKLTLDAKVESVRLLSPGAAVEEGTLRSGVPNKKDTDESRFSAFLVREDGHWRFASVREWTSDEADVVTLDDLAWLVGEWTAKGPQKEVHLSYTRDEGKAFLRGSYTVSQGGKVVRSGTQVIGRDPNGGLRSWQFENDGGFGEWAWSRDGSKWLIEGSGTLPDGSEQTATHLLVPIDKDSFTWQVLENSEGGEVQPQQPPVKVTRVKAGK